MLTRLFGFACGLICFRWLVVFRLIFTLNLMNCFRLDYGVIVLWVIRGCVCFDSVVVGVSFGLI